MADGGNDKSIKFTFVIDDRGLQQAKNAIRELNSEVTKLVRTMSQVSIGGQGGGMGLFGGLSAKGAGNGSGGSTQQQASIKTGSALTSGIAADAKMFGQVAKAGTDAIRQLTSGLRDGVTGQVREIERVKKSLTELRGEYERLSKMGAAGSIQGLQLSRSITAGQNALDSHQISLAKHRAAAEYQEPTVMVGGIAYPASAAPKTGFAGMKERFNNSWAGRANNWVGEQTEGWGGGILGRIGVPMGIGAGIAGGIGLAAKLSAGMERNMTSNAQYRLDYPLQEGRIGARAGGSVGQLGMAIRGGDLASSMAYQKLLMSGQFDRIAGDKTDADRLEVANTASGKGVSMGSAWERAKDFVASGVSGNGKDEMISSIQMRQKMANIGADKAEAMAEATRNLVASNPYAATLINQTYSEGFSDINLARTAAIGLGKNKNGTNMSLSDFKERSLASGYDPGAVAGAMASLGGTAGRGLMGAGQTMLSLQYGGFGNAGQIYGVGAQFGGGGRQGANGLLQAVQHGIGRGGMDVTAGSQVAGMASGIMTSGNFLGASGQGLMQGLLSAGYTGTTGGDMRMARMLSGGYGEAQRNLSGGTDGLQQGINMLAANASGASGWYAKKALMTMDQGQLTEALRTGKLPQHLVDQGVTMDQVRAYTNTRNQYAFSRYAGSESGGSAVGRAVQGVKSAGSIDKYLEAGLKGIKGGAGSKAGQAYIAHELQMLGTARQATEGGKLEDNIGALYWGIAGNKNLAIGRKGHGAGAVGIKGTIAGQVAAHEAGKQGELGEFQAKGEKDLKTSISLMSNNEQALAGLTKSLVGGATDLSNVLKITKDAFMDLLGTIAPLKAAELRKQAKVAAADTAKTATADHAKHINIMNAARSALAR